jgi:hypothetical protein
VQPASDTPGGGDRETTSSDGRCFFVGSTAEGEESHSKPMLLAGESEDERPKDGGNDCSYIDSVKPREMEKSEPQREKSESNDAIYADENVQKFLALLAEIIVDLTLKEYEYQTRNCVPPDQSGAAE